MSLIVTGLTGFDELEETIFESPDKSNHEQSDNRNESNEESRASQKQNGRIISNGSTYSSIDLDAEEEEFELL